MHVVATVSSQVLCKTGIILHWNDIFQYDFCMEQKLERFQR